MYLQRKAFVNITILKRSLITSLVLISASPMLASARTASAGHEASHVLVKFRDGTSTARQNAILAGAGAASEGKLGAGKLGHLHHARITNHANESDVLKALRQLPEVEFAEFNRYVQPAATANDQYYSQEWHLQTIAAPAAWNVTTGSSVVIAILDTGIDGTHPDLAANLVPGYNLISYTTNTQDFDGHGSLVAGAAAAVSNNQIGVTSVCWNCKLMPIVINKPGDSGGVSTMLSDIANGMQYAVDHGAQIENISYSNLGGSGAIATAAQYVHDHNGLVFIGAGNDNTDPGYTQNTNLIAVSGTDMGDVKASFSDYGNNITLSAPAVGIYTTALGQGYSPATGTSFSSPIAAGVAGLVLSVNPSLTPDQVRTILIQSADDLGAAGWDPIFGYGRVNASRAVAMAQASHSTRQFVAATSASTLDITQVSIASGTTLGSTGVAHDWGYTAAGAYLDYNLNFAQGGNYQVTLNYASPSGNTGVNLLLNGNQVAAVPFAATSGWGSYSSVTSSTFTVPPGAQTLRIAAQAVGYNLAGITITPVSTAHSQTATVKGSTTPVFAIDITNAAAFSGMQLESTGVANDWGYVQAAGYIEFDVYVPKSDVYSVSVNYSSAGGNTAANILANRNLQAVARFQNTGAWSNYANVTAGYMSLQTGFNTVRLVAQNAGFNIAGISLTPTGSNPDQLIVHLSEQAYQGDAQYTIAVDGVQVGGVRSTNANHAGGVSESVVLNGSWGIGAHTVSVTFLNDAYGGNSTLDRNLYVDAITYDGVTSSPSNAALLNNGTVNFAISAH